jgi:hypothetical protein
MTLRSQQCRAQILEAHRSLSLGLRESMSSHWRLSSTKSLGRRGGRIYKRCLVKLAKHTSSSFWLHQSLPLVVTRATMYSLTVKGSCISSISNNVQTCATLAEDDCSIVYIEAPRVKITTMDVTVGGATHVCAVS